MNFATLAVMLDKTERPRVGDWGLTASGRQFWPADPRIGDVEIGDIAHHLSMQCRFAGAVHTFYSVAQHSVLVARLCSPDNRIVGLLHDATEAYLQDLIRPLKRAVGEKYREMERAWSVAIDLTFGLRGRLEELPPEVHAADRAVLVAERRDLMHPNHWRTEASDHPRIEPWGPERARAEFLLAFRQYGPVVPR